MGLAFLQFGIRSLVGAGNLLALDVEGQGGALTLAGFFERIDKLSEQLSDEDERGQEILGALYDYAEQIAP